MCFHSFYVTPNFGVIVAALVIGKGTEGFVLFSVLDYSNTN